MNRDTKRDPTLSTKVMKVVKKMNNELFFYTNNQKRSEKVFNWWPQPQKKKVDKCLDTKLWAIKKPQNKLKSLGGRPMHQAHTRSRARSRQGHLVRNFGVLEAWRKWNEIANAARDEARVRSNIAWAEYRLERGRKV